MQTYTYELPGSVRKVEKIWRITGRTLKRLLRRTVQVQYISMTSMSELGASALGAHPLIRFRRLLPEVRLEFLGILLLPTTTMSRASSTYILPILFVVFAFCLSSHGVHAFGAGNIPSCVHLSLLIEAMAKFGW